MAKTKISEFSTTANNNSDINSINISEGCAPSGINDAIRELMRQLKEFQTGGAGDSVNSGGDFSVATNKFTVASASGNTAVAGTLAVTGTTTLTGALVANGNATLGDASGDTVTIKGTPTLEVNPTLSGGTANGVLYLNGSKVATSGSALTFDGTDFGTTGNANLGSGSKSTNTQINLLADTGTQRIYIERGSRSLVFYDVGAAIENYRIAGITGIQSWGVGGSEQMRLTSTGLGIGTSSPANKLDVQAGFISTYDPTNANGAGYSVRFYTNANAGSRAEVARLGGLQDGTGNNGKIVFATSTAGSVTEKMTLDSSGNLGLGVTPSAWSRKAFEIACGGSAGYIAGNNGTIVIGNNVRYNSGDFYINTNYASYYAQNPATGQHVWAVAPSGTAGDAISFTQALTLTANGNLLVGTTDNSAYSAKLVSSASSQTNLVVTTSGAAWGLISNQGNATTQYFARFDYSNTQIGSIQGNNTATSYNTSSDYRLKDNQQPLTGSGAFIDSLQPKTWTWKADGSRGVGFIAHEVQEISPNSVVGEKDGEQMQAMEYGSAEFIANIIAELQSLRKRLADAGIA